MKRIAIFGLCAGVLLATATSRAAIVQLELYNSFSLIDETSTPLLGNNTSGDLVQLILAGANNSVDGPSGGGLTTGDDVLVFSTHVGFGMVPAFYDLGYLDYWPIPIDTSTTNQYFYVRFWNASTPNGATYYGQTGPFLLPLADFFGQILYDFAPTTELQTTFPFTYSAVPEPSTLFPFGLGFISMWWVWKARRRGRG